MAADTATATLPIIDISPLYHEGTSMLSTSNDDKTTTYNDAIIQQLAHEIDEACRTYGFMYIKGAPILTTPGNNKGDSRMTEMMNKTKQFFALPLEQKLQVDITQSKYHRGYGAIGAENLDLATAPDYKETYNFGYHLPPDHPDVVSGKPLRGPNPYMGSIPGWQEFMSHHYNDMQGLAKDILELLSIALQDDHDRVLPKAFEHEPLSTLRMLHYPPVPEAKGSSSSSDVTCGAHSDYGAITLLYQDDIGGLEVQSLDGVSWLPASPIPGTFVVNIGDLLAYWSNDRYRSTRHRVRYNHSGKDRFSLPFFVEPNPDTLVTCLPGCSSETHPPRHKPVTARDYLLSRFAATYGHLQDKEAETKG